MTQKEKIYGKHALFGYKKRNKGRNVVRMGKTVLSNHSIFDIKSV